jgi:inosine/xanthosine triphosphatase
MKKVIITSSNPVKLEATKRGFAKMFPEEKFEFVVHPVSSEVPNQPNGDRETFKGAMNRIKNAEKEISGADFYVGIEGGIDLKKKDTEIFAWIIIKSKEKIGKSRTATFYLPEKINDLLKKGEEVGIATDIIFETNNSKQKGGTVGVLTNRAVDRTKFYEDSVALALISFKNSDLYS